MVAIDPPALKEAPTNAHEQDRPFALSSIDRQVLIGALVLLFVVRLLLIAWLPLVDPTEARYAEIARKMLETGDWITPQFDYGVPFWGKPPLHTWLSALGMAVFGVGPFGARILIFAASLGVLALCHFWVRRSIGRDQALIATVVLASSILFFGASAFVMTDMTMVLGTTMSMVGFYTCAKRGPSARFWGWVFFVGLAIGMLAKGPVAVVLAAIPIFLWVAVGNRWRSLLALPWISGGLLALALVLPWYLAAELKTPGFLRYFIIGEHYERFVVPGWQGDLYGTGHARAKGLIWAFWLIVFLPWTGFAAALLFRSKRILQALKQDRNGWHSYLFFWAISPLILFTPAANILPAYALPGLPAAAILLTTLWASVRGAPGKASRVCVVLALSTVAGLFLVAALLSGFAPDTLNLRSERDLVARAMKTDPDVKLTYWGARSYSAEFYTRGQVHFTTHTETFESLKRNAQRDGVAITTRDAPELAAFLKPEFDEIGRFGRRILFIEKATP